MTAGATEYGLSLGSNLGDRLANLREARRRIGALADTRETGVSAVYETEPVAVQPQYRALAFLNAVLIVCSGLAPAALLAELQAIEQTLGRRREADRNAPRPIDIDIIYAGATALDSRLLQVPHPRWLDRRFVVEPLAELRPGLRLPGCRQCVRDVLLSLPAEPAVVPYAQQW